MRQGDAYALCRAHLSSPIALQTTGDPDGLPGYFVFVGETMIALLEQLNRNNYRNGRMTSEQGHKVMEPHEFGSIDR